MPSAPRIVVVGSLNVDHTFHVPRIPAPGETLTATSRRTDLGGKGANQAVAAVRAGGQVTMIGCVGADHWGTLYRQHLKSEHIDTTALLTRGEATGSAIIALDARGENSILVHPGANHLLTVEDIEDHAALIQSADALLMQLECPLPVVCKAAEIARAAGVKIILNPSPLTAEYLKDPLPVDVLILNAGEASQLVPTSLPADAKCQHLIITRGGNSTLSITASTQTEVPPPQVTPIDTVGAGDSFAGAFAIAHGEGRADAIAFANTAGALATLRHGAQPAIPTRGQIVNAMHQWADTGS
jgi:ribokinase